ncbi:MAG: hypothetical protein COT74_06365 [Bdellovibrionales bacterium CG10_big_fil_rev_8_21_14_0_10_45_34]|nr:MAG: hypothetical protein COT74_06365 [Bdellovibrionales bacterium CG10_big_fil_rev_8_21_14_0_10_45_34]
MSKNKKYDPATENLSSDVLLKIVHDLAGPISSLGAMQVAIQNGKTPGDICKLVDLTLEKLSSIREFVSAQAKSGN